MGGRAYTTKGGLRYLRRLRTRGGGKRYREKSCTTDYGACASGEDQSARDTGLLREAG